MGKMRTLVTVSSQRYPETLQASNMIAPHLFLCVFSTSLAAGGCIGRRFFQASSQTALLRDLRQRIQEVSDFHHTASQALRVPPPHTPSSDSQGDESPDNHRPPYLTSPQLHSELVR